MANDFYGVFGQDVDAIIFRLGQLTTSMSGVRREAEIYPPTFVTCNSPWKCPICYTSWPSRLINWGCLVLYVNCTLINLLYVYFIYIIIIIMVISKCYFSREHIALSLKNCVNIDLAKTNRLRALRMMKNHT